MPRVDNSRFAMVPKTDIPRSTFVTEHPHKTTFNSGRLVPIYVDEVLPGDVFKGNVTMLARLGPFVFPVMDHVQLESFFFFVPMRLTWENFRKMMGERRNPSDSISYTIPQTDAPDEGYPIGSIGDYMGLPTVGSMEEFSWTHNALPVRAYGLIWNEWFRDQNLQNSVTVPIDDGPDVPVAELEPYRRNKKHDRFTSALPWPLKGGVEVSLGFGGGGQVPISGIAIPLAADPNDGNPLSSSHTPDLASPSGWAGYWSGLSHNIYIRANAATAGAAPLIYAEMGESEGITINNLRYALATQHLLEKDARSGTRYTELIKGHFGVNPEDTRLQRPEYIGGGRSDITLQAIPQTSATKASGETAGGTSALGALGAQGMATDQHSFSYTATEHGYIIGLAHVGAQLTYQQGLRKMWSRLTRYDIYWPSFANIGEQAILRKELYFTGDSANDNLVFGYQEAWSELRDRQGQITGRFRSTAASTIDTWHLAQEFTAAPILNASFIEDKPPLTRVLSAGANAADLHMEILLDMHFRISCTRALPMFSIPGLMPRF